MDARFPFQVETMRPSTAEREGRKWPIRFHRNNAMEPGRTWIFTDGGGGGRFAAAIVRLGVEEHRITGYRETLANNVVAELDGVILGLQNTVLRAIGLTLYFHCVFLSGVDRGFSPLSPVNFSPWHLRLIDLLNIFQVPDPRIERSQRRSSHGYKSAIAVCGAICKPTTACISLSLGDPIRLAKNLSGVTQRIPSHDTFGRVFAGSRPSISKTVSSAWVQSLLPKLEEEIVPIDGKTRRHSYDQNLG